MTSALPMDNILKFYGEENKIHRNELIATIIALKQEAIELRTPTESVEDLREEIKALKEKLESVNDVMNTINKIVK